MFEDDGAAQGVFYRVNVLFRTGLGHNIPLPPSQPDLVIPRASQQGMAVDITMLNAVLAAVRFLGPATLVLIALSLLWTTKKDVSHPKSNGYDPLLSSPSPIVKVNIAVKSPRRTFLLTLLALAATTYLLDGTVVILRAVLWKEWEGAQGLWTGIEGADILGLVAFGGLMVAGSWKDAKGEGIWMGRRVKAFALVALLFTFAEVIVLGIAVLSTKGASGECSGDSVLISLASFQTILLQCTFLKTRHRLDCCLLRFYISPSRLFAFSSSSRSSLSSSDQPPHTFPLQKMVPRGQPLPFRHQANPPTSWWLPQRGTVPSCRHPQQLPPSTPARQALRSPNSLMERPSPSKRRNFLSHRGVIPWLASEPLCRTFGRTRAGGCSSWPASVS